MDDEPVESSPAGRRDRGGRDARPGGGARRRSEPAGASARRASTTRSPTVPVYDRGALGAGYEVEGPAIVELAGGDLRRAPGWAGERRRGRERWCWTRNERDDAGSRHPLGPASALGGIAEEMGACSSAAPTPRTSRSGATARPPCSTPTAGWSPRPSTSPSTSARCPRRSRPSRARDPGPATSSSSTTRSRAGRTCPTSRWSRRSTSTARSSGFAVTRAHHSDVGGMRPGSMPAGLDRDLPGGDRHPAGAARPRGRGRRDVLDLLLANVRTPDVRRGDLRAQIAANRLAQERLDELSAPRPRHRAGRLRARSSPTPSAGPARRSPELPDGDATGRGRDGGRRRDRRRHADPRRGDDRRRRASTSTSRAPRPRCAATSTARSP